MFHNIADLYPLEASSTPPVMTIQTLSSVPCAAELPPVESHWFIVTRVQSDLSLRKLCHSNIFEVDIICQVLSVSRVFISLIYS